MPPCMWTDKHCSMLLNADSYLEYLSILCIIEICQSYTINIQLMAVLYLSVYYHANDYVKTTKKLVNMNQS